MTEEQIRKAWANVESLAGTSDYCKHDNDSQDLKDIELIAKLVDEKIREIEKEAIHNSLWLALKEIEKKYNK